MKTSPRLIKVLSVALDVTPESADALIGKIYSRTHAVSKEQTASGASVYRIMFNVIADDRINLYRLWAFAPIWFAAHNKEDYNDTLISKLSEVMTQAHSAGKFSYASFCFFKHGLNIVQSYREHGELQISDVPHKEEHILGEQFLCLLDLYRDKHGEYRTLSPNTVDSHLSAIRMFLHSLEQRGIVTAEQLSHRIISESVTAFAHGYDAGLSSTLGAIRSFFGFLYEIGKTGVDYSEAVPQIVQKRHKIKYGFSNDEVADILGAVNQDTIIGKRDYAMMLVAARTGLRACDIAALKRSDIDWRIKEIRIVQQKTGVPLVFPLTPEVGNAIAEYILNARPETDATQIFLNYHKPYNPVKAEPVGMAVTKCAARVGAVHPITPNRRSHALRRSFAMNLLDRQCCQLNKRSQMHKHPCGKGKSTGGIENNAKRRA
jgi:site-specific recombinase XerD